MIFRHLALLKISFIAACVYLLSACGSQTIIQAGHDFIDQHQPLQSLSDSRQYRHLVLPNGLRVLLIEDAQSDIASASMNVFVGSGADPQERQGLAHFLEHMLFLGSSKYPSADGFQRFISDNSGQHNAYTAIDQTHYFFTIKPEAIEQGLDRFARFFIDPLLDEAYVEREKNAVNSEYQARMRNEYRRQQDVIKAIVDPSHPFSKFSVGSLATLSNAEASIRSDLLAFYHQYYVANNMALAVLSPQPLDQLEKAVRESFSDIRYEAEFSQADWPQNPFEEGVLPRIVQIQPEKDLREISLLFPMPAIAHDGSRVPSLVAHLLGHEGEGSLYAHLKQQGLIDSLAAGTAWQYPGGSAFSLRFGLTTKGQAHQAQVLEAAFSAIALLRDQGIPHWVFDELKQISQLDFNYTEALPPSEATMQAANTMQWYPAKHVLDAAYYFSAYDGAQVEAFLQGLSIDNALIITLGDEFVADQTSPYFSAPYKQLPIDEDVYKQLKTIKNTLPIQLPEKNPFIAQDLRLQSERSDKAPQLLEKTAYSELWHKPLDRFLIPRANTYIAMLQHDIGQQPRDAVLLAVYVALLNDSVNSLVYPASLAGLDFSIYPQLRGLTVRIGGFSEKQAVLLDAIVQKIQQTPFSQAQFQRIYDRLDKNWRNHLKNPPYQRASDFISTAVIDGSVSNADKLLLLEGVKLADIEQFAQQFRQSAWLRVLSNGNVTAQQAKQIHDTAASLLGVKQSQTASLQANQLKGRWQQTMVSEHSDALYARYWQATNNTVAEQVRWMVLAQALQTPFFHDMRTERQLGYVVAARYYAQLTVPGILFLIQSPVKNADELHQLVQQWLEQQLIALQQISADDFALHRDAVMQMLQEQTKTLDEETARFWYELALADTNFDQKAQLQQALAELTQVQWQQFIQHNIVPEKMVNYVISSQAGVWPGYKKVNDNKSIKVDKQYIYKRWAD